MRLLQRIRSESGNDFSREQAGLLESFLDQLIKIQQEQRFVAKIFSNHLEQLRKSDRDMQMCHLFLIRKQKHLVESLCIMSRKSAWLLKHLKDSPFTSPSSIEESNKILDIILVYIPKFVKSKKWLDRYLLRIHGAGGSLFQLILRNNEVLDSFGRCIKSLHEQGVERNSVAKSLLGCFVDVVNMYYNLAELGDPFVDTCSSLQGLFSEAAKETSELIKEALDKLNSLRCSGLTGGGSPLGCIALWRILFESSLINLRLDLICRNHDETVKLGVELFGTATNDQLDQIWLSINELFTVGENVLVEFISMHKMVAEVSYMLGDAFTTGGAGMMGWSDARLLDSFLDILIKIQQEQRFISKSFSEHLEQLRKSGEVAFSSNPFNDDDGDRPKCPIISSDNTMDSYMWQQKHLLDSLCIMSHESVWLLKKLKDSPFTSPSSILEFNKILDIVLVFIPKFKKSKVKLFGTATNDQLDQIRLSIDELLTVGESVLVEFIAMHKTVAEVSYMLGDDFTTGGAGMRGLSDVTHPCKHNDQLMDFNPEDFPWDKHNVPSSTIDPNSKDFPEDYE
ncbi:hypothetical protein C5167_011272 [Papaver somniferum]|uniref:Uncharacterized protein n=1 Tax=Papaver somniferum TaxID=3469 RepID=A0A4Y7K432_PAPSO|nr:hypothetical protein C5167_011272 [Papaver somniferum]